MKNTAILERLAQIKQRCLAARPEPWKAYIEGRDHSSGDTFIMIGEGENRSDDLYLQGGNDFVVPTADYDFIAHARADIPFLLNEIERLQKLLGQHNESSE